MYKPANCIRADHAPQPYYNQDRKNCNQHDSAPSYLIVKILLSDFSSSYKFYYQNNYCNYKENMDQSAHRIRAHHANKPENN